MDVYALQFKENPSTYFVFDTINWELLGNNPSKAVPLITMYLREKCRCDPCYIAGAKEFLALIEERKLRLVCSIYSTIEHYPPPFGTKTTDI